MAILPIPPKEENPAIRKPNVPVKKVDKKLKKLIKDMEETMFSVDGVGIAAPQVGVNIQLALARLNPESKEEMVLPLINPEITHFSEEMEEMEEGCLSAPNQWGPTERHKAITVTFEDLKGQKQTLSFEGFNARIIQHEVDHLNGKLFIDRAKNLYKDPKGLSSDQI